MSKIILISIVVGTSLLAVANSFDECSRKIPDWFTCENDNDCIIIANPCGHPTASTNKKYSNEAMKCNASQGSVLACPTWTGIGSGETKAKCLKKVCSAEKVQAKAK